MRRGSNGSYSFNIPNIVVDKETGEYRLAHHISSDGTYNGKKIIADKPEKLNNQEVA